MWQMVPGSMHLQLLQLLIVFVKKNCTKLLQTVSKKLLQKISYIYLAPTKLSNACLKKPKFRSQNDFFNQQKQPDFFFYCTSTKVKAFQKAFLSFVSILMLFVLFFFRNIYIFFTSISALFVLFYFRKIIIRISHILKSFRLFLLHLVHFL